MSVLLERKSKKSSSTRKGRFENTFIVEYPDIGDLLSILLSISPGPGPLERSLSKLIKIYYKDRGYISLFCVEVL